MFQVEEEKPLVRQHKAEKAGKCDAVPFHLSKPSPPLACSLRESSDTSFVPKLGIT